MRQTSYDKFTSINNYRDTVMTVYEVPEAFPTIFFMQEITEVFEVRIDCVRENYFRVKNCIEEHKEAKRQLEKSLI